MDTVKTKAYKLAAELGLQEQYVLDWLRANGYPNVRRADTIRADVAQAARRALKKRRGGGSQRSRGRSSPPSHAPRTSPPPTSNTSPASSKGGQGGFRMSFADLLEQHLPQGVEASSSADPTKTVEMPVQRPTGGDYTADLHNRLNRAEQARDAAARARQLAERATAQMQAALDAANARLAEVSHIASDAREQLTRLRTEHDRVQLDRSTLRERNRRLEDERATLEQTCGDLQRDAEDLRQTVERVEKEQADHQAMVADLQQAMQREMAWRARALELERAHQHGTNLPALLQGLGVGDFKSQAMVMQAILGHRDTASAFLRAIRQVDAAIIEKLVGERLARVCAHAVCNQVARLDDRAVVRVDSARDCDVCGGADDRRWFARMVHECARAGVRRLLVIGGGETIQAQLRDFSQGRPVDLRLVGDRETPQRARVRGRVEGCDLLVVWSQWVAPEALSTAYTEAARDEARPIVSVFGQTPKVAALARAVCNRLARNHVLQAI